MRKLLLLASLLVTLAFGSFAQAEPTPAPDLFVDSAEVTAACDDATATAALDFLAPSADERAVFVCGSCSSTSCVGKDEGSLCFTGTTYGHCWVVGPRCTGGYRCSCRTGPQP